VLLNRDVMGGTVAATPLLPDHLKVDRLSAGLVLRYYTIYT